MKNRLLKLALFVGIPAVLFAATARIKDFATTATAVASDDYIPLDGTTEGTRKILGARFLTNASVTGTNNVVFDTAPTFPSNITITGNAAPSTTTAGSLSFDNNAWAASRGSFQANDGTSNIILLGVLANDTPSNGQVPSWNTGGTITWETPSGGLGGNYTTTGNILASSGNVTIESATSQNIVLTPGSGGSVVLGTTNITTANVTNLGGATANGQLLIGNVTSGNYVKAVPTSGAGVDITLGAGSLAIGSTDARNFIFGNVTVTTNSTGNITFVEGSGVTFLGNNTTKNVTVSSSGGGYESGDVKFILDSADVAAGWALTGANGIAAFTTPDADYKAVMKMAGTVGTPTFSPPAGAVASGTTITISSTTSGATFMTTNNTTDPSRSVGTAGSTWVISANQTIESMAYKNGVYLIDSAVASAAYTLAAAGPALVAEVGAGAAAGGNTFTSGAINTTGANFIVVVKVWSGATEPDLTDSKSNAYTAAGAAQADIGVARWIRQYYVQGGTVGASHTFTLTGSGHYGALSAMAFSGIAATPFDQHAGDNATAWTTAASGSLTPSQANTVSVTGVGFDTGTAAITEPSGYSAGPEVMYTSGANLGISASWKILTATTPINPDWTAASSYLYGFTKHVNYKY
jgi:hypothetical protein